GTAGLPHVIVRFYTVPKVRDARTSAGWALFFIALLYTTAPAVGAFARTNLVQTVHNKPVAELPAWFNNWKETGLLKFEDKNGDGLVQYYNDMTKNETVLKTAEEAGWKGNELTVDRDIMVLANPEIGGLPNWVVALVAAGGLAAALSTAAGLLLVISTSVAHDLIKSVVNPNITEKGELMAARIAAGGAVIIAGYFGIKPPGFVAQVVAFAFGLAASSFFPLIIMGIFNKRMNREGAIAGLITGLVFTAGYIIYFKFMVAADQNVAANWLFGISPEGIGTVGMLLNFIVAYVVSKFTPAPPQEVMDLVESIRYPRGAGGASAH
ncbi:MAG: cation acetate symporter, partial [Spirochaetae bacterium HGW-Spirochaetae-10]